MKPGPLAAPVFLQVIGFALAAILAAQAQRASSPRPDPRTELWLHLGHLLGQLDRRLQEVQHQNAELRAAYRRLLAELGAAG